MKGKDIRLYLLRFSLIHVVTYFFIAYPFLMLQSALPEAHQLSLDLYEPFRALSLQSFFGQLLRGLAFALIFYPFYQRVFREKGGGVVLFLSLWGLALIASVEPQPGSIEGLIYTVTSFTSHALVIIAVGVQMLLLVWLVKKAEASNENEMIAGANSNLFPNTQKIKGYVSRFVVVHLFTYWVIGGIFYEISGYQEALESMEIFQLWRPLENFNAVLLVFFGQIFRGAFLAMLLYPFYHLYINRKHGWLLLYLLIGGLTILGSPLFLTEFVNYQGGMMDFLKDLILGIPEIVTQMLIFSLLFFFWQRKAERK